MPDYHKLLASCDRDPALADLISGLSLNKYGDGFNAIANRFGWLKTRLGYGPNYVLHSLRKGFATQLENAGVPHNVAAMLLGHELSDMTFGDNSDGLMFERLNKAIDNVAYSKHHVPHQSVDPLNYK